MSNLSKFLNSKLSIWICLFLYLVIILIYAFIKKLTGQQYLELLHDGLAELSLVLFVITLHWIVDAKQEIKKFSRKNRWFKLSETVNIILTTNPRFDSEIIYEFFTELANINEGENPSAINPKTISSFQDASLKDIQQDIYIYLTNILLNNAFKVSYATVTISNDQNFHTMLRLLKAKINTEVTQGNDHVN